MRNFVMSSVFGLVLSAALFAEARELISGREGVAECAVQVIYTNPDLLDGTKLTQLALRSEGPRHWAGTIEYDFAPLKPGAEAYKVELRLRAEKDRSTWAEATPRLTVTSKLKNSRGAIVAFNEANSDQLLTPSMLSWLKKRENTRVVSQMLTPSLQSKLESLDDADVKKALAGDHFEALKVATNRGLMPQTDIYRVDTYCKVDLQ